MLMRSNHIFMTNSSQEINQRHFTKRANIIGIPRIICSRARVEISRERVLLIIFHLLRDRSIVALRVDRVRPDEVIKDERVQLVVLAERPRDLPHLREDVVRRVLRHDPGDAPVRAEDLVVDRRGAREVAEHHGDVGVDLVRLAAVVDAVDVLAEVVERRLGLLDVDVVVVPAQHEDTVWVEDLQGAQVREDLDGALPLVHVVCRIITLIVKRYVLIFKGMFISKKVN